MKTYSELILRDNFVDRFKYLKLKGEVGKDTFGYDRYLNQILYRSPEWKRIRDHVILRDEGCNLGVIGHEIVGKIIIHHMNPINETDILYRNPDIFNPEYLICVDHITHNAIHYGDESILRVDPIVRKPNDTCPWKK